MPKKTKKQKIIAQYRKKIKFLETKTELSPAVKIPNKKQPKEQETIKTTTADDSGKTADFFIQDFKKSLFLSFAIIALEIILYFATINNYLKLR